MTGWKKNLDSFPTNSKRSLLEFGNTELSVHRQTQLLNTSRSFLYYVPKRTVQDETLMAEIDKIYTDYPFFGSRRIQVELEKRGYETSRYQVGELMKLMEIQAIYPKKKTSIPNKEHKVYPYLLRDTQITYRNQVWSTDITYIKLVHWWLYLSAVIDWYSRKIVSWKLSNTMDIYFCMENLKESLECGTPKIFNTDQWSQYTSTRYTSILEEKGIQISMDGVRRCLDNIYIERFWRTIKYEDIFLHKYENMVDASEWIRKYIEFYNTKRPHQSLDYLTPEEVWNMG